MAREIRKKVIDQEMQAPDDGLDAQMMEQIEKEFSQISSTGGTIKDTTDFSFDALDGEGFKPTFSLDDFESSIDKGDDLIEPDEGMPLPPPTPAAKEEKPQGKSKRPIAWKKMLTLGFTAVIVLAAGGFGVARFLKKPEPPPPIPINKLIKHPITVQLHEEQFDFFILGTAQKEKDLISLGIQFQFPTSNAYEDFLRDNIVFRDIIYQFLQGERPVKNSFKYWQQIVEGSLFNYLRTVFPQIGMSAVHIVYLDRL